MTVTGLVNAMKGSGEGLPQKPIVLTFDDGFADFYTDGFPLLRKYGFSATLYVTTAFVGETSLWLKKEKETSRKMLNWEQLSEVHAYGIECGAHSHTHPELDSLPSPAARDEILRSKIILEEQLGPVNSFAYPFGYFSPRIGRLVREAGYSSACAVKYASSSMDDDPFALPRFIVPAAGGLDRFRQLLGGGLAVSQAYLRARFLSWQLFRHGAYLLKNKAFGKNS